MKRRSQAEAERIILERYPGATVVATGVRKACPRCSREGWVFSIRSRYASAGAMPEAFIIWDGRARGWRVHGTPYDCDILGWDEVLSPDAGCGYDGPAAAPRAEVGWIGEQ